MSEEPAEDVNTMYEAQEIEDGEVEEVDLHPMDNTGPAEIPQSWEPVAAPSEREIEAAGIIQRAWHRLVQQGRGAVKVGLREARSRHFAAFYTEAQNLEWSHRGYGLLYLGPLPHILVCLEFSGTHARSLKNKAKQRFSDTKHQELEDCGKRLTLFR
jgi:hypothetical protein